VDSHGRPPRLALPEGAVSIVFAEIQYLLTIERCREILVTIHVTINAVYTPIQCLQKRYRPVGEATEEIQSLFSISS